MILTRTNQLLDGGRVFGFSPKDCAFVVLHKLHSGKCCNFPSKEWIKQNAAAIQHYVWIVAGEAVYNRIKYDFAVRVADSTPPINLVTGFPINCNNNRYMFVEPDIRIYKVEKCHDSDSVATKVQQRDSSWF